EISNKKSRLHFMGKCAASHPFVTPAVDRRARTRLKPQMPSAEHIHERAERLAKIHCADAGARLRGQHVIDYATEQYALASARGRKSQDERGADDLTVKEIDADELSCRQGEPRVWAARATPFGFGRDERGE